MLKILWIVLFFASATLFCQYVNDDNNLYLQGQNYEMAGYMDKARPIFEDLYRKNVNNPQYFNSLNRVYLALKLYDASIKIIEQRIENNPSDLNLYGLLGCTYYLRGDEKRAFSVWEDGIKKVPESPINFRVMANYALERRAFDKAIDFLNRGNQISDNPLLFSFDLANLYALTMQYNKAAEEYWSILNKYPEQFQLVQSGLSSFTNKSDALQSTIEVFEKKYNADNIKLVYILASLYLQSKSYEKAYTLYDQLDAKSNSRGMELLKFAQEVNNEHQFDLAAKVFSKIIVTYPSSPIISNAKLGYAKALESSLLSGNSLQTNWKPFGFNSTEDPQKINEIINYFTEIAKIFPNSDAANEALYRIGNLKFSQLRDFEGARQILNKLIALSPNSQFAIKSYEELGDIYIQEGNLDKGMESFQKLIYSNNIPEEEKNYARYKEAKISFYKGNFETGKEWLNSLVTNYKDNNSNDALELELIMNTTINDSSNLVMFADAELLSEQKKFNQAREKYLIISTNQQAAGLQNLAKLRVAEMDLALDNYDSAIKLLGKIVEENEKNIYSDKALYLQGNIYQYARKDKLKAIEAYETLLAKFPNSIYLDIARELINKLKNKIS
jgi:tetratricopeptide (TPR) repeat protein